MKLSFALPLAALCATANLCTAMKTEDVVDDFSRVYNDSPHETEEEAQQAYAQAIGQFEGRDAALLGQAFVVFPILDHFNKTVDMDTPGSYTRALAELSALSESGVNYDDIVPEVFPDFANGNPDVAPYTSEPEQDNDTGKLVRNSRPQQQKRASPEFPTPCQIEIAFNTDCRSYYFCQAMCIEMPKNFPYITCGPYLDDDYHCPHGDDDDE
ncbi:hypothetical protein BDV97DRAFT_398478 [Delphinella strobiligena]|nr:hypothetical protein BDV97DRAFT_398478 [Delphinella strobiligena]